MNTVEKVISTTFDEIDKIKINVNERTGLKVKLDNFNYEFIINLVENEDTILVFSPPFINSKKAIASVNKAVFFDEFEQPINYNTIYYNDPTRYNFKDLNNGWGVGTEKTWHLENIAKIIKKLAGIISDYEQMTIPKYSNILFYGNSMGGFMSIALSTLIKNSTSISDNPQTNLFNHSYIKQLNKHCFKNLSPNQIKKYSYRLNIIDLIQKENYIPNSYIFYDTTNLKTWDTQYKDFLNQMNTLPYNCNDAHNKINISFDGYYDSNNLLSEYTTVNRIKNIINVKTRKNLSNPVKYKMLSEFKDNLDNLYLELNEKSLNFNNYIKHTNDFMDKWSNLRVDIKNKGNYKNKIEILEHDDKERITFPSWYKNDDGVGCSILSSSNILKLKIKCKNDGMLNIILRGQNFKDMNNHKHPIYVCYDKLKINDETIFLKESLVWHDKPYKFSKECNDGEILDIEIHVSTLNNYYPLIGELISNLDKNEETLPDNYEILSDYLENLIIINNPLN